MSLGALTRKNDISSIWQVIGDVWNKVKQNEYSQKFIESYWLGNHLLAEERLNILVNTYDRLCQRYYQAYKGIIRLDNFPSKIIKRNRSLNINTSSLAQVVQTGRTDDFILEYKYFFNEIKDGIRYIYPPRFLTNDYRSPELINPIFSGIIHRIYPKENKITIIDNSITDEFAAALTNYMFLDNNKNPFIITRFNKNEIFYKRIITGKDPVEGNISIVSKFELQYDVDYKVEIENDFLIFRFKDFNFIGVDNLPTKFFSKLETFLYGFDVSYLDKYGEINFGYPIGLTDNDFDTLYSSGFSWPEINQMILDGWKIEQKISNFNQIYRYAALFSGNEIARTMIDELYLYKNDYVEGYVYLGKSKGITLAEVINEESIPDIIKVNNRLSAIPSNKYLKINSFILNPIFPNDIIILDKEAYSVVRSISDTYIELDRDVLNHPITNIINILDKNSIKKYRLNSYGSKELNQFTTELPNGDFSNLSDIIDVTNTIKWGDDTWGSFKFGSLRYQQIHPLCRFKKLEIGDRYEFGDCFQPYILPNFYFAYESDTSDIENKKYLTSKIIDSPISLRDPNKNIPNYYIQKQLALENKEFTENNFLENSINKSLLLLPFFNYSNKLDVKENNIFERSDWNWGGTGTGTHEYIYNEFYGFSKIKTTAPDNELTSICHDVDLFTNNKTGKSLLRMFVRINSGKLRIGVSTDEFFDGSSNKYIFEEKILENNETPSWDYINIFIDNDMLTSNENYKIVIASYENSSFDIFGIQLYTSIPSYFRKLFDNREILGKFVSSHNYKLLNLI